MVRCVAITNANRRCKKQACYSEFCSVHGYTECKLCEKEVSMINRHTLKRCGHSFCTECLVHSFYTTQWFEGFSTENVIKCPECELEVCDSDWTFITDHLCKTGVLQRKIIFDTYLYSELCKELHPFITIGKEHSPYQVQQATTAWNGDRPYWKKLRIPFNNTVPDIVYFEKWSGVYNMEHSYYRFFYGDPAIRKLFHEFQRELVEYVFYPKRIERFGGLEYLDQI